MPLTREELEQLAAAHKPEAESLAWKALGLLSRPNAAVMGMARALIRGDEDPIEAFKRGLLWQEDYSGRDVLESLRFNPESFGTKAAGFAMDVLNPFDPLNYLGIGALTKTGRAAKTLGKLAPHLDEAARLGQRALLSWSPPGFSKSFTLVRGAPVLGKMEEAWNALRKTRLAEALRKQFQPAAELARRTDDDLLSKVWDIERKTAVESNRLRWLADQQERLIRQLSKPRREELAQMIDAAYTGAIPIEEVYRRFPKQRNAIEELYRLLHVAGESEGPMFGLRRFYAEGTGQPGYLRHLTIPKPDTERAVAEVSGQPIGTKPRYELPVDDNIFNYRLRSGGTLPPEVQSLKPEGWDFLQKLARRASGDAWETMTEAEQLGAVQRIWDSWYWSSPKKIMKFTQKYRRPLRELAEISKNPKFAVTYEMDAAKIFRQMTEELAQEIHTDDFLRELERANIAEAWDYKKHLDGNWVRVREGRWDPLSRLKNQPLAVPKNIADAFDRYIRLTTHIEESGPFYRFMHGLLSIWKPITLYYRGTGVWTRNLVTGYVRNAQHGMVWWDPQTYRMNAKALSVIYEGPHSPKTVTLGGRSFKISELWNDVWGARGAHGGGGHVGAEATMSRMAEIVGKPGRKVTELSEQIIRWPLLLKNIEDGVIAAKKAGLELDRQLLGRIYDNAANEVLAAHFDYSKEAFSAFENKWLRGMWVPFYSWTRRNVPHEFQLLFTEPGKFMPYVRLYYNAWSKGLVDPRYVPEWMRNNLAIPLGKDENREDVFADFTNYLPIADLIEIAGAFDWTAKDRQNILQRLLSYATTRMNPIISELAQQKSGKDWFTNREMTSEMPREMFGLMLPGGAPTQHAIAALVPPAQALDILNPFGIWTKLGRATGTFRGGKRPHRDEPTEPARWLRMFTGLRMYTPVREKMNLAAKERERRAKQYLTRARRARREGAWGEAEYYMALAREYSE